MSQYDNIYHVGDPVRIGPNASVTRELRGDTGWVTRIVQEGFVGVTIYGTEFVLSESDLLPPVVEKGRAIIGIPPKGMEYKAADGSTWVFTGRHKVVSCAWAYSARRNGRQTWVYLRNFQQDVARKMEAADVTR